MYRCIALLFALVRLIFLPNPFECFGNAGFFINMFFEPIIHVIAFALVGLVYERGSAPILGSFLYMLAYSLIIGILMLMSIFSFAWWWVITITVIAAVVCAVISCLAERWLTW